MAKPPETLNGIDIGFENGHLVGDFEALSDPAIGGHAGAALIDREMQVLFAGARASIGIHAYPDRNRENSDLRLMRASRSTHIQRGEFVGLTLELTKGLLSEDGQFHGGVRLAVQDYVSCFSDNVLVARGFSSDEGYYRTTKIFGKDLVVATADYQLANQDEVELVETVPSLEIFDHSISGQNSHRVEIVGVNKDDKEQKVHRVTQLIKGSAEFLVADLEDRLAKIGRGVRVEDGAVYDNDAGREHTYNRLSYVKDALRTKSETVNIGALEIPVS